MIMMTAVIVGLVAGVASGGNFAAVKTLRLRWLPLLFVALFTQIAIFSAIAGKRGFVHEYGPYIHIATLLVTLFVMSRNLHIPGMKIIMLGAALNALVVIANGGYMPSPEARLDEAGRLTKVARADAGRDDAALTSSTVAPNGTGLVFDSDVPLLVLGDIFAVPKGWPLANVFSIGDVLIAAGVGVALVRVMRLGRKTRAAELHEASDSVA